jgi:hypothetical protein
VIPSGLSTKKAFLLFSTVGQKGLKSACKIITPWVGVGFQQDPKWDPRNFSLRNEAKGHQSFSILAIVLSITHHVR